MEHADIEVDYVIVGAGAAGLAFADELLDRPDVTMAIVDRRFRCGGHWNDAYPFVRLHGPATHYGVNSRPLGTGRIDDAGPNAGLLELATGAEVLDHFERTMTERLLPSGRVAWLPGHDWRDDGIAVSLRDGGRRRLRARRRIVDATGADTRVPAIEPPPFEVEDGVTCVPPGALPGLALDGRGVTVVGAGKTAMDTVVWLLARGTDPDDVVWIRPRDPWLLDRARVQSDDASFERTLRAQVEELEAAAAADGPDDLFARLEAIGALRRIDRAVAPTAFRCAVVSDAELATLRRVERVLRLGRVSAIRRDRIVMRDGTVPTSTDRIHVHCAADGLPDRSPRPIFRPGRIELQYVRRCSPCFSAAMVAHLEATMDDDATRNAMSAVVPLPRVPLDWARMAVAESGNARAWNRAPSVRAWLSAARLNAIPRQIERGAARATPAQAELLARHRRAAGPAIERLSAMLAPAVPVAAPA